ncbi:hypothetical protein [Algoriphagus sp.]|uniref:hypothetical protein n=1 Tax=Algoriphagus sp. TaxID=1872435 RepID=UPI0032791E37
MTSISSIDLVILLTYLLAIILIGLWFSAKTRKSSQVYILGGRSITEPVIGISLFAFTNTTVRLVDLADSGISIFNNTAYAFQPMKLVEIVHLSSQDGGVSFEKTS